MDKIREFFKRPQVWGFFVSVAVMAVIALLFFYPDNFEGNSLRQPDMQQGAANGKEAADFQEATGEKALWTNSLFSGMPTFQISPSYPSNGMFTWLNTLYGLGLPAPSNLLFMMMFGFLILLYAMRMRWYYALIGSIAWGFSSYFVIIIGAGHIWKFLALTYVPPTIAGFILLYRGHRLAGASLLALFAMLQLNANHPQMTYYFGLTMVVIALAFLVEEAKAGRFRRWLGATAIALGCGILAVGANAPSLYNTYEYSKETKRSQSELTPLNQDSDDGAPKEKPTGGLPKNEITGWSYGQAETFSLMVPNIRGGASARPEAGNMEHASLARLDEAGKYASEPATSMILQYLTQYFNNSEGTNGPVYVGIIIAALFILGCIIVRGALKWALLISTVLSVVLAWGYNMAWLTDIMIYHFPMYNKFRAVESILVVAEFCMPFLGILALAQLFREGRDAWQKYRKPVFVAFGIPAAVCLLAMIVPSVFGEAITDTDNIYVNQLQQQISDYYRQQGASEQEIATAIYEFSLSNPANVEAIKELRYGLVRGDGLRSLLFLVLAFGILWLYTAGRLSKAIAIGGIGVLVLADLFNVDKRYVSHSSFGPADGGEGITFVPDRIDAAILADTSGVYRVADIPEFTSARRSYFHKMIGGYHAAKLNRYEDLIQRRLMPMLQYGWLEGSPVLDDPRVGELATRLRSAYKVADMLNARYIITGDSEAPVLYNDSAMGNAWLVDEVLWADNADGEMAMLSVDKMDFNRQAVADRRFEDILATTTPRMPGDTVYMTSYTPNELTYRAHTTDGGTAVFSEIYFPWGWHATVDGVETPLARVNYVLRAVSVPAGTHEIRMVFAPASLRACSAMAYACITLIYLLVITAIFAECRRCRIF